VQTARDGVGLYYVHVWHAPYRSILTAWCSLVLGVCSAYAVMSPWPLEELAKRADMVVLGTVIELKSAWDAKYTAIHTDVTLAVEHVLAGRREEEVVTLQVAGGSVRGIGMRTSHDATFQVGERVIVFLDRRAVPSTVVGMQQGKFAVTGNTVARADEAWDLQVFMEAVRAAAR